MLVAAVVSLLHAEEPCCEAGLCGTQGQAGMDLAEPGSAWDLPLALCSQYWLRLFWFSWEGRSRASLCPGLLGTSHVPGSAAPSASHLCPGPPGHKFLPWVVLWWGQLGCSNGVPVPYIQAGCSTLLCWEQGFVPRVPGLGPSSPSTRAGDTGGYHGLCPPWSSALGCSGEERLHSGLLFFPPLFILIFKKKQTTKTSPALPSVVV